MVDKDLESTYKGMRKIDELCKRDPEFKKAMDNFTKQISDSIDKELLKRMLEEK